MNCRSSGPLLRWHYLIMGGVLSLMLSPLTQAVSFVSFDPRSMALGGVGVANADLFNASLFNPSLAVKPKTARREGEADVYLRTYLGSRLNDRDDFLNSVEQFKEADYEDRLKASLKQIKRELQANVWQADDLRSVSEEAREAMVAINSLSNRPLRVGASYGMSVGRAEKSFGLTYHHRTYLVLGSRIKISALDNFRLQQMMDTLNILADVVDQAYLLEDLRGRVDWQSLEQNFDGDVTLQELGATLETMYVPPALAEFVAESEEAGRYLVELDKFVEVVNLIEDLTNGSRDQPGPRPKLREYLRYPIPDKAESIAEFEGADITEDSIGFAHSPEKLPYLSVGVNFKLINFTTIAFDQRLDEFDLDRHREADTRISHRTFNADAGAHLTLANHWLFGVVVRNIIAEDYRLVSGRNLKLRPDVRLGVGYTRPEFNVALDVDLTRNEALGFDPHKKMLGIGIEWLMWGNSTLRGGYRTNLLTGEGSPSVGMGIAGDNVHLDFAVVRSQRAEEYGLAFQIGAVF